MNATSEQPAHILALDGVRGVAIALVLLDHSLLYVPETVRFKGAAFQAGYAGVTVFFVLSGYLISRLLLREEQKYSRIDLRRFYARRAFRLFPALWLYLLTVGALRVSGLFSEHPWHSVVSSLLYLRNFVGHGHETDHLWSLAVEEHFYLVWPVVILATSGANRLRLLLCVLGVVGVLCWRWVSLEFGFAHAGTLYIRTDFRFDGLLLGCAVAVTQQLAGGTFRRVFGGRWLAEALGVSSVAVIGALLWVQSLGYESRVLGSTPFAAAASVLVATAAGGGASWCCAVLRWRVLTGLGQVSYGVYLWQQLFLGPPTAGMEWIRSNPLIGLTATAVVALLSYWCLERPLLRWKDRYYQHRGAQSGAAAAAEASDTVSR